MLKSFRFSLNKSFLAAAAFGLAASAPAATLTWDGSNTGNAAPDGGTGAWDANVTANWWNGSADVKWTDTTGVDTAVFANTAGTVTLASTVNANALTFNTTGYTLTGGTLTFLGTTPTITTATGVSATIVSAISGASTLTKAGAGTLTLSGGGANYTGATRVSAGTLELLNAGAFNSAVSVANGATLMLSNNANIGAAGGLSVALADGATLVHNGTAGSPHFMVLGGAVTVTGNTTINQISGADSGGVNKSLFLDGGLKGSGTVTINATNANNAVVFRNNNSTFSGTLVVNGVANAGSNLGSGIAVGGCTTGLQNADIQLNGTMELLNQGIGWAASASGSFSMGALSGSGVMVGNFTGGGVTTVTLGNTNNSGVFSGVITNGAGNTVNVVKTGKGTQTLSGANTYTGTTTVNAGTLKLTGTLTSAITVNSGGILTGSGSTTGNITFAAGSGILVGAGLNAVQGVNVSAASPTTIFVTGGPTGSATTVDVIRYTGTSPGTAAFSATGYRAGAITDVVASKKITLTYTAKADTWNATSGGTWDVGTSTPWSNGADSKFFQGDSVTFGNTSANQTVTLAGTLAPSSISVTNTANTFTFSGAGTIAGATTLTKSGAGMLRIASDNHTFTGGTNVTGGTLVVDATTAAGAKSGLGAGAVTVNGATLTFRTGSTGNAMSYANSLNLTNATLNSEDGNQSFTGTVNLTGTNTFNIVWGGKNATFTNSIGGTGILNLTNVASSTSGGSQGGGVLFLNGANSYSGGTTITSGTLSLGSATAIGTGLLSINGGAIDSSVANLVNTNNNAQRWNSNFSFVGTQNLDLGTGAVTLGTTAGTGRTITTNGTTTTTLTIGGAISNGTTANSIIKAGVGVLALGGNNTYTGGTTINAGEVQVRNSGALGTGAVTVNAGGILDFGPTGLTVSNNVTLNGGMLSGGRDNGTVANTYTGTLTLGAAGGTLTTFWSDKTLTLTGKITGSGGLTVDLFKAGNGAPNIIFSGSTANNYTGLTQINSGSLVLSKTAGTVAIAGDITLNNTNSPNLWFTADNQLSGTGVLTFANNAGNHGRFMLEGTTQSVAGINNNGTASGVVQNSEAGFGPTNTGNGTLILTGAGSYSFAGYLRNQSGTLALVQNGTGTQTLSGNNINYTGTTTVNAGTLVLNGTTGFQSATTVNTGATLGLAGGASWGHAAGNSLTLNNGSILSKTSTGYDAFDSSDITVNGTVAINITNNGNNNQLFIGGTSTGLKGSGTINVTNTGAGTTATTGLTLRNNPGAFTGNMNVAGGALNIGGGSALVLQNTALNLTGANLNLAATWASAATDASVKSLSGNTASSVTLGSQILTLGTSNGTGSFAGVISGTGSLIKMGTGTQTLSGVNTYTGGTTINEGTLALSGGRAIVDTNTVTLANTAGATLKLNAGETIGALVGGGSTGGNVNLQANTLTIAVATGTTTPNFSGSISGSGSLVKSGAGTQVLSGANTYTGTTTLSAGTLELNGGSAIADTGAVILADVTDAKLQVDANETIGTLSGGGANGGNVTLRTGAVLSVNAGDTIYSGVMSGAGGFAKTGTGSLTLLGDNTYTGTTSITSGATLIVGNGGVSGAIGTGDVTLDGTLDYNRSDNVTVSSNISGGGLLEQRGSGTLTLSGANTHTGLTSVVTGTVALGSSVAHSAANAGPIAIALGAIFDSRGFSFTANSAVSSPGALSGEGELRLGANGVATINQTAASTTFSGVISGSGSLTKGGAGTLVLAGASTFTGNANVNDGVLQLGNGGNTGSIQGVAVVNVGASGTLAFNRAGSFGFAANIDGNGGVTQQGPAGSVVTLNGTNSYTGLTHVVSGTLRLGSAGAFAGGPITIDTGATFDTGDTGLAINLDTTALNGGGNLLVNAGNLTVTNNSAAQFDGVITGSGNFIKQGSGDFTLTNSGNTFGGSLTVSAGNLVFGGASGTITSPAGLVTVTSPGGLVFDHTADTTFAAKVTGSGVVVQRGPGATNLTGLVSGGVNVTNEGGPAGTFTLSDAADIGVVTNAGTTILRADSAGATAGTATVASVSNSAGTLSVGSNVTGAVTVSGGKVVIGADQADTYAKLTGTTTSVQSGGTLAFGGAGSYSVTGLTVTGTGVVEQAGGASTITLAGANAFDVTSTVRMSSGTLAITDGTNVGSAILEMNGGKLQVGVTGGSLVSLTNEVHAVDNTLSYLTGLSDVDLNGPLTGTGAIRYKGPGVLDAGSTAAANEAAFIAGGGQIIRDGGILDIKGVNFGATNFDDSIGVTNTGANASFIVQQNQDGTASGVLQDGPGAPATNIFNLVKNGAGMLTLTGSNTYTGTTTVNEGVLRIGDGSTLGSIAASSQITINAGGTLAYAHSDDIAVANLAAVNGGTLSQRGTGVVELTEDTTVGNITGTGRLKVDTALIVDTSTGAVKSGDTFAGALSGPGTFTKRGTGTLVVTGDGALTTTARVEGGTLQLGDNTASGSVGTGDIALSGGLTTVVAFDRSDVNGYTFAGKITGSGVLLQEGAGTLILTGTNTFAGKTVIASGSTLQLGNGGSTGRLGGGLVDNSGLLAFNRSGDYNFTNPITGTGAVEQRGPGTLTLTGTNTYSGDTRVVNGVLVVNTNSLPTGRFVADKSTVTGSETTGTLVLTGTGEGTVRNGISGSGHVRFTGGGGVTTLLGDSSGFSGDMNVESGHTLQLGVSGTSETLGSGAMTLNVLLGGKLTGTGVVGGNLSSRGAISPGYSPGIITVTGNFTTLGTLNMEIAGPGAAGTSTGHDQILFGGQATLGGTLNVSFTNGFAPAVGYRAILLKDTNTADGLPSFNGSFTTVNVVGGAGRLIQGADTLVFFNGTSIAQVQGLQLHEGVGPFADALSAGPTPHPQFANFLLLDAATLSRELQNASPIGLAALTAMPTMQANRDADEIRRRAESQTITSAMPFGDDADWLVYAGGAGYMLNADSGSSSPTFDTRSYGGAVGLERRLGDGAVAVGVRLGYDRGTATLHDGGGKVDQDHARGLLYTTVQLGDNGYLTGGLGMGYSTYETRRTTLNGVNADGTPAHATQKASPSGWDLSASLDGGYIFRLNRAWSLTPHAGITLTQAQVGGYTEKGSDLALTVDGYSQTSARTRLGSGIYREWHTGYRRAGVSLGLDVAYEHTLFGETADIPASFAQSPQSGSFKTEAPALIKDSLVVGPQLRWMIGESSTITAGYRFEMGFDGSTGHRGDIAFEQRF